MDSSSRLKASSEVISYASSIHSQHSTPFGTLMDVTLSGSSMPTKRIFCPVGLYVISSGLFVQCQYDFTPRRCIAQQRSE